MRVLPPQVSLVYVRRLDRLLVLLQLQSVQMVRKLVRGRHVLHLLLNVVVVGNLKLRFSAGRHVQAVQVGLLELALQDAVLVLLLDVLLDVLELLRVVRELMLMTGLRKVANATVEAIVVRHLHLTTIYLHGAAIDAVLTGVGRNHLILHGSRSMIIADYAMPFSLLQQRLHCGRARMRLVDQMKAEVVMLALCLEGAASCLDR